MKACILKSNNNISFEEIEPPKTKESEVLLKVCVCGICSSDYNRVFNNGAYFYPIILGHEFSGEIIEIGKNIDKKYLNKHAVVFPLLPCNECEFCKIKSYAQCKNYKYFGSRCNGAMAEYIAVPIWNVKLVPDDMRLDVAAMCEPTAVAIHATSKISDFQDKNVCVIGTGIIGIIAGFIAKSKGANVRFIVRNESKKNFLQNLGFKDFIEQEQSDNDIVFECVGSNQSLEQSLNLVKSKGQIVLVGNPYSDMTLPQKVYWKILRSEITIFGVWNSSYKNQEKDDWDNAIEFLYKNQEQLSNLITDRFSLKDGINAFNNIKSSSYLRIKGVFENDK